jgi:putative 4-mercaptohistidine N1-methyltranferase
MQGDACNLLDKFNDYDVVFAGNLLERLYDPAQFLALIQHRIRPGGLLVLASTYTWQEKYTPRDKWLGGFKATTGENFKTLAGLAEALAPRFTLISQPKDIPFVIRETARKFQYGISELTVWEKQATGAR